RRPARPLLRERSSRTRRPTCETRSAGRLSASLTSATITGIAAAAGRVPGCQINGTTSVAIADDAEAMARVLRLMRLGGRSSRLTALGLARPSGADAGLRHRVSVVTQAATRPVPALRALLVDLD